MTTSTAPIADTAADVTERNVRTACLNAHVFHDNGDVTLTFRDSISTFQWDMTTTDARLLAEALVISR